MRITSAHERRHDRQKTSQLLEPNPSVTSLLVHLRRDVHSCVASFSGSITGETRVTIDGIANLVAGEQSVVLDFSRVDEIDSNGAEAVAVLLRSMRAGGTDLRIAHPRMPSGNPRYEGHADSATPVKALNPRPPSRNV